MAFDAFAKFFIAIQHKIFYVVMMFARFNLYVLSYTYLAKHAFQPKRSVGGRWWWWGEVIGLCTFFYWYSSVLMGIPSLKMRLAYLAISHIVTSPLHVQVRSNDHLHSFSRDHMVTNET